MLAKASFSIISLHFADSPGLLSPERAAARLCICYHIPMNIRHVKFAAIFDMDGVLLDSPKLNWQANNQVLGEYGVTISTDQFHLHTGRTLQDSSS